MHAFSFSGVPFSLTTTADEFSLGLVPVDPAALVLFRGRYFCTGPSRPSVLLPDVCVPRFAVFRVPLASLVGAAGKCGLSPAGVFRKVSVGGPLPHERASASPVTHGSQEPGGAAALAAPRF